MPTAARAIDIGTRRAERHILELAHELRERRLMLALSQEHVAQSVRMQRRRYGRIERGQLAWTVAELDRIAAVLGLELSVRLYPGGPPVRDAAQAGRLQRLLDLARRPPRALVEVPLPRQNDRLEQRAWDAMLVGGGARTAIELEMRLRDVQAIRRRHELKRRDDPTESFVLVVADTRTNRRVLAEFAHLFADLPRLKPSLIRAALLAGEHPPTGLLLT